MSFRENLLKKIEIDRLAKQVTASMGPPDSGRRLDRDLARRLLGIAGYEITQKRDLELYLVPDEPSPPRVLVLDNDFSIYTTTPEDVAMRKSPVVKEMVKIRNIIKILNDGDVVASKKGESVEKVRADCIAALDLTYTPEDIEEIEKQGAAALANNYSDGISEALELFRELLGYTSPPGAFKRPHQTIIGKCGENPRTGPSFGPMVFFNRVHNTLRLLDTSIPLSDKAQVQTARDVADGNVAATAEGPAVFAHLKGNVTQTAYQP